MKIPYPLVLLFTSCFGNNDIKSRPADMEAEKLSASSFYDFRIPSLDGDTIDFSRFRGKKVLIVNTASKCGYTPQYAELQKLHEKYKDKIVVLGFPSNDFKNQEPAGNKEIREFCTRNYGVTFPMSEKITVKGEKKHPLYQWLTDKNKNGWNTQEPTWNFCKYLVNEKGELVKFFPQGTGPMSKKMIEAIEAD